MSSRAAANYETWRKQRGSPDSGPALGSNPARRRDPGKTSALTSWAARIVSAGRYSRGQTQNCVQGRRTNRGPREGQAIGEISNLGKEIRDRPTRDRAR